MAPELREHVAASEAEAAGIVEGLGGLERVSEQRLALIRELVRTGVVVRALFARFLREGGLELEALGKLSTLIGSRRQALLAIGLERVAAEVLDLGAYLEQRGEAQGAGVEPLEPEAELEAQELLS